MNNQIIKEAMIVDSGKMKYCVILKQSQSEVNLYINNNNKLYFESNRYFNHVNFELGNDVHKIAKEMFLTHLQTEVKTRLLELKQLELILDELGLIGIIRQTLVDNGSLLIDQKDDIIKETVERSTELIGKQTKKINKEVKAAIKKSTTQAKEIAADTAAKVVDDTVIGIAKKKKKGKQTG